MSNSALPTEETFLTKPELARLLKVSLRTITKMMAQGDLPYLKLNRRLVRFRLADVNRCLSVTAVVGKGDEQGARSPEAGGRRAEDRKAGHR